MTKIPEPPKFNEEDKSQADTRPIFVGDLDLPEHQEKESLMDLPAPADHQTLEDDFLLEPISLEVEPAQFLPVPAKQDLSPVYGELEPIQGDLRPAPLEIIPKQFVKQSVKSDISTSYSETLTPAPKEILKRFNARQSPDPKHFKKSKLPLIISSVGIIALGFLGFKYASKIDFSNELEESHEIGSFALKSYKAPDIIEKKDQKLIRKLTSDELYVISATNKKIKEDAGQLLINNAKEHILQGNSNKANEFVLNALLLTPYNEEIHMVLAQILLLEGQKEEALKEINLSIGSKNSEVHMWRGKILEHNKKPKEAIKAYELSLKLNPELYEARMLYARLLTYSHHADEAEKELILVVEEVPNYAEAWLELGRAQRDLGKHKKASVSFKKAFNLNNSLTEAFDLWKEDVSNLED